MLCQCYTHPTYPPPLPLLLPPSSSLSSLQAVFRVYDTDHSGNITVDEFDAISSNFPFIECFSVLDQDKSVTLCYTELHCVTLLVRVSLLSPLPFLPPSSVMA